MRNTATISISSTGARARTTRPFYELAPTASSTQATAARVSLTCATTRIAPTATAASDTIHPSALITATGSTEFLDTRRPAPATGLAGTAPPLNSFASAAFSTTKRHTPVTGLKTWGVARSTLSARTIQTATCPWANPATATGPAKEATPASNAAQPCWYSTKTANAASPRPLRIATFPPPPPIPGTLTMAPLTEEEAVEPRHLLKTEDAFNNLPFNIPSGAAPLQPQQGRPQ